MLWHATSPCSERSECRRFEIRWRPAGFGIWIAAAFADGAPIGEWVSGDREDAGKNARSECQRLAWGWMS